MRDEEALALGLLVAAAIHGSIALALDAWVAPRRTTRDPPSPPTIEIEPVPPPDPPVMREPARGAPVRRKERIHPPAPAALAGRILSAIPDPDAVVDMTEHVVAGAADGYAGGETAPDGTSSKPALQPSAGRIDPPLEPDRSRPARSLESLDWRCPFPEEAQIDHAVSTIRVEVDTNGTISHVVVIDDPGSGFGREAGDCARRRRWGSALDRSGSPTVGSVIIRVRFDR
jgi:hypothetical protein